MNASMSAPRRRSVRAIAIATLLALSTSTCEIPEVLLPGTDKSGRLIISLSGNPEQVEAMLIELAGGGGVTDVSLGAGVRGSMNSISTGVFRLVALGPFGSEVASLTVKDTSRQFSVRVIEAARGESGGFATVDPGLVRLIAR